MALPRHGAPGLHARWLLRGGHLRQALRRSRVPRRDRVLGARRQLQHRSAGGHQSHGRLHEGRRSVHRLHDARLPGQVQPLLQDAAGRCVSTFAARTVGGVVRRLRRLSNREANREHRWDVTGEVPSGWAHVQAQTLTDKAIKFFYAEWQHMGSQEAGTAARKAGSLLGRRSARLPPRLPRRERRTGGQQMTSADLWAAWRLWMLWPRPSCSSRRVY